MVLHKFHSNNITVIQNRFIDEYMISANGEFVKVYLYLLRCSSSDRDVSLASIADALCHTENDIRRALAYWEKLHLLHLSYDAKGQLTDISFTEPENHSSDVNHSSDKYHSSDMKSRSAERILHYAEGAAADQSHVESPKDSAIPDSQVSSPEDEKSGKIQISADRKRELSKNEEIRQLLFVAEQYLGKHLSPTEINHLLYFYDELHLSAEVIEYLIEYCVSKGIHSIHYIKKVAFEWSARGVQTVQDAKDDSSSFHKDYYSILKAFGIHNRGPAKAEITYMDNWLQVLGYSMDIILEAVNRTITKIHNPSFPYADRILQDWYKKGVHHLKDIAEMEKTEERSGTAAKAKKGSGHAEQFGFEPRDYDFRKLEEQLLDS